MAHKNQNLSIAFEEATTSLLAKLAHQEHKTLEALVKELTLEALEQREDYYLSKLAEKLDAKHTITYSHEDAWK